MKFVYITLGANVLYILLFEDDEGAKLIRDVLEIQLNVRSGYNEGLELDIQPRRTGYKYCGGFRDSPIKIT